MGGAAEDEGSNRTLGQRGLGEKRARSTKSSTSPAVLAGMLLLINSLEMQTATGREGGGDVGWKLPSCRSVTCWSAAVRISLGSSAHAGALSSVGKRGDGSGPLTPPARKPARSRSLLLCGHCAAPRPEPPDVELKT